MNLLKYLTLNIAATLLRVLPLPCRTGLTVMGNPDGYSPVFLTSNYRLTVERVKRALRGVDAYLLIANGKGVNVWCAATGGLFTTHAVISALKTTGIEDRVGHRTVILPQLAATGIESTIIRERTGWRVVWGPVYAKDIPAFLKNAFKKSPEMREVRFPWTQRLEMAAAWAFPISLILALIVIPFWREATLPLILLVWGLSPLIFLTFPLYHRWLSAEGKRIGFIFFDFGRGGFQLVLWGAFTVGLVAYAVTVGYFTAGLILRWSLVCLVVVLLLSIDLMGSTPVYKSGLHEDRLLRVALDEGQCKGAGHCEQVCPRNCYEVDKNRRVATMPRIEQCVRCGACIVQCPFNALYFAGPEGRIIPPETVRRFKLNLIGKRPVKAKP